MLPFRHLHSQLDDLVILYGKILLMIIWVCVCVLSLCVYWVCGCGYSKYFLINNNKVNNQFDLLTYRSSSRTHWFSRESSDKHETYYRSPEIAYPYIVLQHSAHCGSCPLQKYQLSSPQSSKGCLPLLHHITQSLSKRNGMLARVKHPFPPLLIFAFSTTCGTASCFLNSRQIVGPKMH